MLTEHAWSSSESCSPSTCDDGNAKVHPIHDLINLSGCRSEQGAGSAGGAPGRLVNRPTRRDPR